jgi:outer membrane protein assembly factor BamB
VWLATLALLAPPNVVGPTTTLWPTYHLDPGRGGDDTNEPSFAVMTSAWTSGSLDGAVYAEPLIDGNSLIVATENDSVYAFDTSTGSPLWHTSVGTPRTSNFLCGDINPLGITGTPVIDAGYLYVLAETQRNATSYAFRLVKLRLTTGHVVYSKNVTPTGMVAGTQQERSALNISNGNVVITWGGLDGDCGSYHGYVETVAESTGAVQSQWHDTPQGNEGGIWGTSGPAVDASGNIYVSTGNGSSSTITNYDYGDSVLKFTPALALSSYFAPGPPQSWASLNASDQDLGSLGPSLLPGGLLFAIGKGGRGYLLNQSQLPSNANPGGGENFSARLCHRGSSGAFSGLAVAGNVVLVPCTDGIAAVNIDSSTAFHRTWYSTAGSSAPIVAGGLVWSLSMFGGSTLFGLSPSTGKTAVQLTLPASTEHFATPTSGDGMLFVGAGNIIAAFAPFAP